MRTHFVTKRDPIAAPTTRAMVPATEIADAAGTTACGGVLSEGDTELGFDDDPLVIVKGGLALPESPNTGRNVS